MNLISKYMFLHDQTIIIITNDTYKSYSLIDIAFDDMNALPMNLYNGTVGNVSNLIGTDIRPIISRKLVRSFTLSNMTKVLFKKPNCLHATSANLVVLHKLSPDDIVTAKKWHAPFSRYSEMCEI